MRRRLVLLGPSQQTVQILQAHKLPYELYSKPLEALDSVGRVRPNERKPLLAYGELAFGPAVTGQAVAIAYDGPTVVINDCDANKGRIDTTLMYQAANRLRAWSVLILDRENHLQQLRDALEGRDVPRVTMRQKARAVQA